MTSRRTPRRTAWGVALTLVGGLLAGPAAASPASRPGWFAAWSRPQSVALAAAADALDGGRGPGPLVEQTVRDVVRITGAGTAVRFHLTNRYGAGLRPEDTTPLVVGAVRVARRDRGAAVVAATSRVVTFGGRPNVTIAPGATEVSDPVDLAVRAGDDLAVSLYVPLVPMAPQHGASFVTSFVTGPGVGDRTGDVSADAFTERTLATLILTGVDVRSTQLRGVVAATGGSVTDGHGSGVDEHTDFPSWLARRLSSELPPTRRRTVVNNGLGGTAAAAACAVPGTGPSVEERVAHDSLRLAGLTHLVVYAGTNDLAAGCSAEQILAAYRSIVRQARAAGVRVLVSTITPRASYTAAQNAERAAVNAWVRRGGTCGGECHRGVDVDAVVRDPGDPDRIDPEIDSGDGIHPNGEGYRRIADAVPLDALR